MVEIWKPVTIPEFGPFYDVSNLGRVRSHDRLVAYSNGVRHLHKGRILVPVKQNNGYYIANLYNEEITKAILVHRLVALAFIPNPRKAKQVNHKNFDKSDNSVANLEWCSALENSQHSRANREQRRPCGEGHGSSKLTWEIVCQIRLMAANGVRQHKIASEFGITQGHVSDIVNFKKFAKAA